MYQVFINDDADVEVDELLKLLRVHHVVVLNAFMRIQARNMRKLASDAIKNWNGTGPHVHLFDFELPINGERWFALTFTHSTRNLLTIEQTHRLVERAVLKWVERGMANNFLYTNRTELQAEPED